MTMRHWLAASCALGLLAAGPVLAQNETKPADGVTMSQPSGSPSNSGSMDHGSGMHADSGSMNKSSMPMHKPMHSARNGSSDMSQNARVDQLNDQSYQAAQQGKPFMMGASGDSNSGSSMNTSGVSGSSGMNSASPSDTGGMGASGGAAGMSKSDGAK